MLYINLPLSKMSPQTLVNIHFTLLAFSLSKYACHIAQACPIALIMQSTCRPHITAHIGKKLQTTTLFPMLKPYMCQQQINPSNAIYTAYANYFICRHETMMSYIYLI